MIHSCSGRDNLGLSRRHSGTIPGILRNNCKTFSDCPSGAVIEVFWDCPRLSLGQLQKHSGTVLEAVPETLWNCTRGIQASGAGREGFWGCPWNNLNFLKTIWNSFETYLKLSWKSQKNSETPWSSSDITIIGNGWSPSCSRKSLWNPQKPWKHFEEVLKLPWKPSKTPLKPRTVSPWNMFGNMEWNL